MDEIQTYIPSSPGMIPIRSGNGDYVKTADHTRTVAALQRDNATLKATIAARESQLDQLTASNEALLAQVTWTRIDAEHLPKVGDELGGWEDDECWMPTRLAGRSIQVRIWRVGSIREDLHPNFDNPLWTHYRPIAPPTERPQGGGKP